MRQYLLGTLPDPEASAVEELCFTNPQFSNQLRAVEIDLISAYLTGKLSSGEHDQFESRYLAVPALKEMVERVRVQHAIASPASARRRRLRLALASSIAVLLIAVLFLRKIQHQQQLAAIHPPDAAITLFLEPGVTMGTGSQAKLLRIPQSVAPVSLIAELPGLTSSVDYIARLRNVDTDRTKPARWTSAPIRSVPRQGGQQVTVILDSSFFSPGDYILELETQDGKVRESYVLRAIASSQ